MKFHNLSIGNKSFGEKEINSSDIDEEKYDKYGKITNIHFTDEKLKNSIKKKSLKDIEDSDNIKFEDLDIFLKCLALCSSVIVEKDEKENIVYHASSIDEKALLNGARYLGYIYLGKDNEGNLLLEVCGELQKYQVLSVIDFDSKRKRMSVIIKDLQNNKIILLCKGADTIIRNLSSQNKEYFKENEKKITEFSSKGLRNLNIAYKFIEENEFRNWDLVYKEAISPLNTKLNLEEVIGRIENNLYLLGIATIEDELQEDVEDTLNALIENGLKVWMLTGDQKLTAKSIAKSCKMITEEFDVVEFDENGNKEKIKEKLEDLSNKLSFQKDKLSMLIGTDDINIILLNEDLKDLFYKISVNMNSVIFFRATPKQKAEMVNLVKTKSSNLSTLAIGDGANDVNMITCAHVGVGIFGEEGKQAARASDYSISQFSYLKKLLLFHGREFYRKNTYVICYNFYKNGIFVITQFWYGMYSMFSGQTMYDKLIYQIYNFLYSSFPIIYYGVYDKEFEPEVLMNSNKYYIQGIVGKLFHTTRFWKWNLVGFFQALFIVIFHFYSFTSNTPVGYTQDMWSIGTMAYSSVIIVCNLRLLFSMNNIDVYGCLLCFSSIFFYFITIIIMNLSIVCQNFYNFTMIIDSLNFYLSSILIFLICYMTDNALVKLFTLYGCIRDPTTIKKNEIPEFTKIPKLNKSFSKENKLINNIKDNNQDKDGFSKVYIKEN